MNRTIRKGLIALAAGTAALAMAGVALGYYSNYEYTTSSQALDGQYARAHSDDSSYTTRDLLCPDDARVTEVSMRHSTWGVYGSIDRVEIECTTYKNGSTSTTTKTVGYSSTTWDNSSSLRSEACNWDEKYIDGLNVVYDNYVKDAQVHCAATADYTESGVVLWPQEWAGWVLDEYYTDGNDDNEELQCNSGKVMTGLRVRYRSDADEIAVTRMQLYCSTINFD